MILQTLNSVLSLDRDIKHVINARGERSGAPVSIHASTVDAQMRTVNMPLHEVEQLPLRGNVLGFALPVF